MSQIDSNWLESDFGSKIFQSILQNGKLKNFGLLEKPTLASPYNQYQEVNYKIMLIGKSFCGKTTFIDSMCNGKQTSSSLNTNFTNKKDYCETPGISVTHFYWPVKVKTNVQFLMFNLAMWDVGKLCSLKYEYILPSTTNNLDCFIFVFSWTDKQSFIEVFNDIKQIYQSTKNQQTLPKLIIGTKFDKIVHSEIEQEMINELESLTQTRIIRFSSFNCNEEQIQLIMNRLCDMLWERDQELISLKNN